MKYTRIPAPSHIIEHEIFRSGMVRDGRIVKPDLVKALYVNTKKYMLGKGFVVPIGMGHNDPTEPLKGELLALTLVTTKDGYSLFAKMFLFAETYELYKTGRLPGLSIIIIPKGFDRDGKTYGATLGRVDLLGTTPAADPGLKRLAFGDRVFNFSIAPETFHTHVQSVIFDKEEYSQRKAERWCKRNGVDPKKLNQFSLEIMPKKRFVESSLVTNEYDGLRLTIGNIKETYSMKYDLEKLQALREVLAAAVSSTDEIIAEYTDEEIQEGDAPAGDAPAIEGMAAAAMTDEEKKKKKEGVAPPADGGYKLKYENMANEFASLKFTELVKTGKLKSDQRSTFDQKIKQFGVEEALSFFSMLEGKAPPTGKETKSEPIKTLGKTHGQFSVTNAELMQTYIDSGFSKEEAEKYVNN